VNEVECVVIGAGVVGLATARALALAGYDVLVLERASTIGFETSSRNSEVIHGGLYYPAGSLKARCCVAGRERLSPSTGIIDSHALMLAFQGEAEAAGAMVVLRTPVLSGRVRDDGFDLAIGGDEPTVIRCRCLVNATGLYATALARSVNGIPRETIPPAYFCRGVYFSLTGPAPFRRLVYPVPPPGGLGVHITLDLAGQARFGPDVEWIAAVDYTVDPARGDAFYAAIRTYWPALRNGALQPGYAGIRPKISGPEEPAVDFILQGPEIHGVSGLVNLYGIESPGLTASMPLADEVIRQLTLSPAEQPALVSRPAEAAE